MKSILFAAALALAPSTVLAQAAAATLPNTMDRPAGQAPAATPTPQAAAPVAPVNAKAEETLRAFIAGAQAGAIDYGVMTPDLAAKVKEQEGQVAPLLQQFGALQSVRHAGVEGTSDLFLVAFANQATQWLIGFDDGGKVAALLFRPAP